MFFPTGAYYIKIKPGTVKMLFQKNYSNCLKMYFMTLNAFIQIVPGLLLDGQQWDYAIIFKPI